MYQALGRLAAAACQRTIITLLLSVQYKEVMWIYSLEIKYRHRTLTSHLGHTLDMHNVLPKMSVDNIYILFGTFINISRYEKLYIQS